MSTPSQVIESALDETGKIKICACGLAYDDWNTHKWACDGWKAI